MSRITQATCLTCGLCCVSPAHQDAFCDVTGEDMDRLGKPFVRLHVVQPEPLELLQRALHGRSSYTGAIKTKPRVIASGPLRGLEARPCVALRGTLGVRVSCSVYAKRPQTCRTAVVPGDRVCRTLRVALVAPGRPSDRPRAKGR